MIEEMAMYEPPAVAEVGEFSEVTRLGCCGRWLDNTWIAAWFDF